jgi:hypothetical protein
VVDDLDALAAAHHLLAGLPLPRAHVVELGRELRRRCTPARSAKPSGVTLSTVPMERGLPPGPAPYKGVWLDVASERGTGAGVLFNPEEWASFACSVLAVLGDVLGALEVGGVPGTPPIWPPGEPPGGEEPAARA